MTRFLASSLPIIPILLQFLKPIPTTCPFSSRLPIQIRVTVSAYYQYYCYYHYVSHCSWQRWLSSVLRPRQHSMLGVAEGPMGPVRIPMMPCCVMTVALEDQPDRLRSKKSQMWHLLLWSVLSCKPAMTRFFIVHTKAPLGRLCLSVRPSVRR